MFSSGSYAAKRSKISSKYASMKQLAAVSWAAKFIKTNAKR